MLLVGLLNPAVTHPAGDNLSERHVATEATLQSTQVIYGERGSQLVEHRVVGSISLTLILGIDILTLQSFTEGFDLLTQTILSHHQRKLQTSLALPPFLTKGQTLCDILLQ